MRLFLLPFLALAAGCHAEQPDWADNAQRRTVPVAACVEVEKAVAQLKAGHIDVTDAGEATMPAPAWNAMAAEQHDQMLRTLAFHAACRSGAQSDAQPVVVRGDDGSELARRTISTKVDAGEVLRD